MELRVLGGRWDDVVATSFTDGSHKYYAVNNLDVFRENDQIKQKLQK